ncbi:hypothetical protein [Salsuginibacillus kocurii]|uniref:hypothetical protein n=1 Tax=Salsuginibacillus kocurii TaxID=427078 RepID=UPI00036563E0|nr:hypothetical protein [Salsuginibacillus kocurii]
MPAGFLYAINGEIESRYQEETKRPLASTYKIIRANGFAEQIGAGKIEPDEVVSIQELIVWEFTCFPVSSKVYSVL